MNPFISIDIVPGVHPSRIVTWGLDPAFKGELPYQFRLEVAEDPTFKELNLTIIGGDSFFIEDKSNTIQSFASRVVYRVVLTTGDGKTYVSPSVFYDGGKEETRKYLYAAEIVRKELLRSSRAGSKGWLLKRKNYSALIADELDPVSGVPISDNKLSFGTKFQGGYYAPLAIQYTTEDHDDELQLSQEGSGVRHDKTCLARLIGFPSAEPHDILISDNGVRFNVVKTKTRLFPGTRIVLVQNCNCVAIPPTDPVYSIVV